MLTAVIRASARAALAAVLCVCCYGDVFGQAGFVGLYADAEGTDCRIEDKNPGLLPIYAVHNGTLGATACQFKMTADACFAPLWLSDLPIFPVTLGNSQDGVAIGYAACLPSPIHVLTINFFGDATTTDCCEVHVVGDPSTPSGTVVMVDCLNRLHEAPDCDRFVNPVDGVCKECELPVAHTTWGRLKAVFSD
jgi:hypothetical protein